ncbi:MAG: TonB-dependent receptor [Bacteroidota bacterium]
MKQFDCWTKLSISLIFLLFSFFTVTAQVDVSGKVVDTDGLGLVGVNVVEKGTDNGTVTDYDGKFSLTGVSKASTLEFSYIGYATQSVLVGDNNSFEITMAEDQAVLGEVVVIGYGQTQNKRSTTTAIATISSSQIDNLDATRTESALQGLAPGVVVAQTSGSPGAPLTVRMRGIGSPNASAPLYLVNGVQVPSLEYLNSDDIESISILKDAASAAIYGSRGGNGVVLVQTKTGSRKEGKPSVTISGYYGFQNLAYKPELMNRDEYITYYNDAIANAGEMPVGFRGAFSEAERAALPDTDWYDVIFESNAPINNTHISITDGGKVRYSIGAGLFNQQGLVGGDAGKSDYQRINARGTLSADLLSNLEFTVSADYTQVTRNFLSENNGGTGTALMNYITAIPAIYPTHAENGEVFNMGRQAPNPSYNGVPLNVLGAVTNPLWSVDITNQDAKQNITLLSGGLSYQPIQSLSINGTYSYFDLNALNRTFVPFIEYPEQTFTTVGNVRYSESPTRATIQQYSATAEYSFDVLPEDHNLKLLAGSEVVQRYLNQFGSVSNSGSYLVNDFDDVNFALATDISTAIVSPAQESEVNLISYFGRLSYEFQGKYLFSASIRNDRSSNFGGNKRSGWFPSVSAGWVLSEESFFQSSIFDLIKLRASWGINGSDAANPYSFLATVATNAQVGGAPGITLTGLANPDLKWEELTQTNVGIDINAFNNKFGLTIDYYIKDTDDILLRANTPLSTGLNPSFVNVGSVKNTGLEILLSYRHTVNEDFKWNANLNIGFVNNEVTSLGNNGQALTGGNTGQLYADPITLTAVGHPISSFYGYEVEGLDAEGNLIFADLNNSGNDKTTPDIGDKTFIGNPSPDFTYGLSFGASYKGFDLGGFFYGSQGNDIFDATIRYDAIGSNRPVGYTEANAPGNIAVGGSNGEHHVSDFHVRDGSFLKLKNLTVGYSFPESVLEKIRAENLRLYISGQNLVTFTKYTGADPEIGENSLNNFLDLGIDRGFYPQPRTVIFGFQLGF